MDDDSRVVTTAERVMGMALLVLGVGVCLGAPFLALPWALEQGRQSPRFLTFVAVTLGATWFGLSAVRTVLRMMGGNWAGAVNREKQVSWPR